MITKECTIITDSKGKELTEHGTPVFPLKCYEEDVYEFPVPWHWHDDWEIILSTSGVVRVIASAQTFLLAPGDAIFLGPGILHEVSGDAPCEIHSVVVHPHFLCYFDNVIWQKYVFPVSQKTEAVLLCKDIPWQHRCIRLFKACWDAIAWETPGYEVLSREYLTRIAYSLSTQAAAPVSEPSVRVQRNSQRIKIMLEFIQEHCTEEISTAEIAASAMISESECLRCFRSTINTTPGRYLKAYRIQRAAELLISTEETAGDICYACGFHDAAYFTKLFREAKGCTPLASRQANRAR